MFKRDKSDKDKNKDKNNLDQNTASVDSQEFTKSLEDNISIFKNLFIDDDTFIIRRFENQDDKAIKYCVMFIAEMVDNAIVSDNIIKPLVISNINTKGNMLDNIMYQALISNTAEKTPNIQKAAESMVRGETILLVDGFSEALVICTIGWQTRSITEPEGERVIRGPREGFTESMLMNLTMIRRRISSNKLKFKFRTIGEQTHTKICICYVEGIVNEKILKELNKRLDEINIDGIMGSGLVSELIKDAPFSPFKTVGSTERPDVAAAKMLEGRIVVVIAGTPVVLTLPYIFIEYFQTNEDYYINFYFTSINRILRILSFIITISLPAVYLSLTAFHQEMVPTPFIRSISAARQGVPFPTVVELAGLLFTFELLREAGTRMPLNLGQPLSIVGALALGQSAVEARIVSAPVVIVVALTALTGLILPRIKGAEIILRFIFLMLSAVIGLYGYIFGMMGLLIHLYQIRSFGVPYMLTLMNFSPQDLKDTAVRAPWMYMKYRPKFIAARNNRIRNTSVIKNHAGGKK